MKINIYIAIIFILFLFLKKDYSLYGNEQQNSIDLSVLRLLKNSNIIKASHNDYSYAQLENEVKEFYLATTKSILTKKLLISKNEDLKRNLKFALEKSSIDDVYTVIKKDIYSHILLSKDYVKKMILHKILYLVNANKEYANFVIKSTP